MFVSMHQSPSVFESHITADITPASTTTTMAHMMTTLTSPIVNGHHRPYPYHPSNAIDTVDHLDATTHFAPTVLPEISAMTTDTIFSHYRQPEKQLTGPMYLIIEGHSKVKTYGGPSSTAGTVSHAPKFVPVQSTVDPVVTRVVNEDADDGGKYEVRHLHYKQPTPEDLEAAAAAPSSDNNNRPIEANKMSSLLSLLDTSFGDFFSAKEVTAVTTNDDGTDAPRTTTIESTTDSMQLNSTTVDDSAGLVETTTLPMWAV